MCSPNIVDNTPFWPQFNIISDTNNIYTINSINMLLTSNDFWNDGKYMVKYIASGRSIQDLHETLGI